MLHGSGPSSSPNAIRSSAFPNAPFNSSEHTTPRCRKARHVGGTCCASKTMSHSRRSSLEREEAFCGVEKMSADTYFGVDRPESTRSRVSSPRPGQFPTSNSSSSIASLSRIRQKSPAVISTPFRQPVGDTAGRQTFTFSPLKSHSVRQTEAARGTPSPSDVGRSFASQRERGRGSNVGRNEGLLAAVPRVPPSPGGPCNLFASHRQSVQQSFAVSRDTGLCSSTRHATRSPYSFVTSHQTASSSVSCSRTVALSSLFSRPVVLSCSSRALSGISTSRHPLASSASSSFSKGPSSLASEHEEDVLLPVPCSLSQPQETGPQSPDGLRDAHRGSRLCVSVPFTCTSPPCRPSSSPVSFSLSRPRKSRAPSSSPSRVMSASLQSLARAPPPLATTRAARSIIVSSPQTASKSCAFSEARGPGSPRQSAKGGARAPFTSDAVHRASDSRGHCTVQPASGPPAPAVGGSASSSFSSSSGSLPSGTVEKGRDSVACMSKQVGTTREREVVRIKSETHDRESVGERWRGGRAGRGDSMLAEERELYPQGPLDTQWRHGGESTRRRERINQSGSELEPGHGGVACTRRWHGGDFLGTRGDSPDLPRLVGRRVSQRETAAAAVAAAAVEGRGDTGRGPDSEVFLGQRSTFSGMCKWLQHRFYGRGELERLCGVYSPHEVERVVLQSKALSRKDKHKLMLLTLSGNCSSFDKFPHSSDSSVSSTDRSPEGGSRRRIAGRSRPSLLSCTSSSDSQSERSSGPASASSEKELSSFVIENRRRKSGVEKRTGGFSGTSSSATVSGKGDAISSRGEGEGRGREDRSARDRTSRERDRRSGKVRREAERGRSECRPTDAASAFFTYEDGTRGRGHIRRDRTRRSRETRSDYSEEAAVWEDRVERAVLEECVEEVQKKKLVKDAENFRIGFLRNLAALRGVTFAVQHLSTLQRRPVDSGDVAHQEKFSRLWGLLMPRHRLPGRICKEWKELGFQGEDPATDFRGCGQLGLDALVFLASRFPTHARAMLEASHDSRYWYSFAITSINVTSWVWEWLVQRRPQVAAFFFFCAHVPEAAELAFHFLFSYVFTRFHEFWFSKKPASIMEFPFVAGEFKQTVRLPSTLPACALLSPRGHCNSDERREEAWCYMAALQAYQRARKSKKEECRQGYDDTQSLVPAGRPDDKGGARREKMGTDRDHLGTARATGEGSPALGVRSSRHSTTGAFSRGGRDGNSSASSSSGSKGSAGRSTGACKQRNESIRRKLARFSLDSISPRRASKDTGKDSENREWEVEGTHKHEPSTQAGTAVKPKGVEPRTSFFGGNSLNLPFRLLGSTSSICFGATRPGIGSNSQSIDPCMSDVASERRGATEVNSRPCGVRTKNDQIGGGDKRSEGSTVLASPNRWNGPSQGNSGSSSLSDQRKGESRGGQRPVSLREGEGSPRDQPHFGACPCCSSWHPLGGHTGTSFQSRGTDRMKGGRSRSLRRLPSCLQWARSSSRKRYSSSGFRFPGICRGRSGAEEEDAEKRMRPVQGGQREGEGYSSSGASPSPKEKDRRRRSAKNVWRRQGDGCFSSPTSSSDDADSGVRKGGFRKGGGRNVRKYRHLSSVSRRSTSHRGSEERSVTGESGSSVGESMSETSGSRSSSPELIPKKERSCRTAMMSSTGRAADHFSARAGGAGGRPSTGCFAPTFPARRNKELRAHQPRPVVQSDFCSSQVVPLSRGGAVSDGVENVVCHVAAEGQGTCRGGLTREHPVLLPIRQAASQGNSGPTAWSGREPAVGGADEPRLRSTAQAASNSLVPLHSLSASNCNYSAIDTHPYSSIVSVGGMNGAVSRPVQIPRCHHPVSAGLSGASSLRDEVIFRESQKGRVTQNAPSSHCAGLSASNPRDTHEQFTSAGLASSFSACSSPFVAPGPVASASASNEERLPPGPFLRQTYNVGSSSSTAQMPLFLPSPGKTSSNACTADDQLARSQKGIHHPTPGTGRLYYDASGRGTQAPAQQQGSVYNTSETRGGLGTGGTVAATKAPALDLLS